MHEVPSGPNMKRFVRLKLSIACRWKSGKKAGLKIIVDDSIKTGTQRTRCAAQKQAWLLVTQRVQDD